LWDNYRNRRLQRINKSDLAKSTQKGHSNDRVAKLKVAYKEFLKTIVLGLLAMVLVVASVSGFGWAKKAMTHAHQFKELVEQAIDDLLTP
jgi:hypothetical protein